MEVNNLETIDVKALLYIEVHDTKIVLDYYDWIEMGWLYPEDLFLVHYQGPHQF